MFLLLTLFSVQYILHNNIFNVCAYVYLGVRACMCVPVRGYERARVCVCVNPGLTIMAAHRTFSGILDEFPASC